MRSATERVVEAVPAGGRQLEFNPNNVAYYNDAGTLLSRSSQMQVATSFQSGDRLEIDVRNITERLDTSRTYQTAL